MGGDGDNGGGDAINGAISGDSNGGHGIFGI